jgi:hypothetical protein
VYLQNILQVDFTFNLESFKSFLWGDTAVWYQYDSTNPDNPDGSEEYTNYKNYFFCTDSGLTIKPILMTINLSIKLRNCYKTLIQSLTDWSNWTKIGLDTDYFGLLDYCKASDAESITLFSWNPVSSDQNYLFWGNTEYGNPSIDWEGTETGSVVTADRWSFSYCNHLRGTEYDLNNGGAKGDLFCSAASPWKNWAEATTAAAGGSVPAYYDKTKEFATCV